MTALSALTEDYTHRQLTVIVGLFSYVIDCSLVTVYPATFLCYAYAPENLPLRGTNAASLSSDFPGFLPIHTDFLIPVYQFLKENDSTNVTRSFVNNTVLSTTFSIQTDEYQQPVPLETMTSSDYFSFLLYYVSNFRNNRAAGFNYQTYLDGMSVWIDTKQNTVPAQTFVALPFLLFTGDLSLLRSAPSRLALTTAINRGQGASPEALQKYLTENLFLINVDALGRMVHQLADVSPLSLLLFLSFSLKSDGHTIPTVAIPDYAALQELVKNNFGGSITDSEYNRLNVVLPEWVKELVDFPIAVPEIKPVVIKGTVKFSGNEPVVFRDLSSYDLVVDYQLLMGANAAPVPKSVRHTWTDFSTTAIPNRTVPFDFDQDDALVVDAKAISDVTVSVKLFDGTIPWTHSFAADDPQLASLAIEVPLAKAVALGGSTTPNDGQTNLSIKGKVLEMTGNCPLQNLTVLVQAKTELSDPAWRVVSAATTDSTGNFVLPYPLGVFVACQAIVSLTPDSPVTIPVYTDEVHQQAKQTISSDFLYLLVEGVACPDASDKEDDCDCHSPSSKTPRLPNHEDLIGSDKFSQDLGGGTCVNLTTPNRTLSEQNYYAIVRTSDPDVANYVLEKTTTAQIDGFQKVTFSLGNGKKIERVEISFDNAIRWQDAPDTTDKDNHLSIYQAVSVAHGHLLHYKSVLKADGYSLGNLLYSLPLAPGQKKEIVMYDWKRSLQGSETQQLTQREGLTASITNDRTIIDDLSGGINESLSGQSSANTGGISAGLGAGGMIGPIGAVLGVSGGYASSSSQASQDSSRNTVQAFGEVLRNSIMQSASAYRQLNGTLIDTVTEGQQYATTTEVVANHNHCHTLTMLYFEVLRHYAVYQELSAVEECIFVPLIMTNFSMENIHKWRDVLAANLLNRPSNTYLPAFFTRNPLVKAFDANDRVLTNWANVDYPVNRYCDETMLEITGQINFRVNIPRPKTRFDRILSLPVIKKEVTSQGGIDVSGTISENIKDSVIGAIVPCAAGGPSIKRDTVTTEVITRGQIFDMFMTLDANYETVPPAQCIRVNFDSVDTATIPFLYFNGAFTPLDFFAGMTKEKALWDSYAALLGISTNELLHYFTGNVIADWDRIFNEHIAPQLIEKLINENRISISPFNGLDFTALDKYNGGDRLLHYNLRGGTSLKRTDVDKVAINYTIAFANQIDFFGYTSIRVESLKITYATNHYNGTIVNKYLGDDLKDGVANIFTPLTTDEKRNPRKEDKFIVNELITHLNSNLEYYNKVLWYNLDPDRRYMLLDGFHIQVYDDLNQPGPFKSLASIVKNQLIGVAGNSLIFPVAAGVKVDRSYIIVESVDEQGQPTDTKVTLFDHYKPLTSPQPYRISVPSRGVFAEAVQGACDACEKVKDNSSQDWNTFTTDEPTAIAPVTVPTPTPTDWKAAFKDFAPPMVNIQNAPVAPAPGAGLAGLNELLGKSDIFKDITGLDANQKNAMATYLSNQENAKAFAQMAKDMAMQAHNTQNDDKIKGAISGAQGNGTISKDDASKLTKDHIQQMIDGGDSKRLEVSNAAAAKPSLTDAAVKAVDQGKSVKAERTDVNTGQTEKVDIQGNTSENVLASIQGIVPALKQENDMACWATAATMMMSWKKSQSMTVPDVLAIAGPTYVQTFTNGEGLASSEKEAFITALGMVGEPPASYTLQQYINWVTTYGPLWITTDSSTATGVFSPHARILTKITGAGTPDGNNTYFTFNDPATGTESKESFQDFLKAYEQMVTDNPSTGPLFIQIVHFSDAVGSTGEGRSGVDPYVQSLNTYVPTAADTIVINKTEFKNVASVTNWKPQGSKHNTVLKKKRTPAQVIHLVLHETAADTGDGYAEPYTAHMSVRADASVLQFNDLLEIEYHGNNFNDSSVGIEFVNRGWLASPKTKYKDTQDGTWKSCPARGDTSSCNGCQDCDSRQPLYSYEHEAIPTKESSLTNDQKDLFKEDNGYVWCFWGFGFNIYRLPQHTDQLEKEVELVKWLTIDLPAAIKVWKDGGGWLSGKPELPTLATWLSLPAVPNVNMPLLDVITIANKWLQVVSYNDVKALWTFKAADIPADADKDTKQFFVFTTAHDYLTPTNMSSTSGILSHNSFYEGHSDGSFLTLYTWLRLEKNKAAAKAFDLAKSLMKNQYIVASLKTNPNDKKIILLKVNDSNLV